MFDPFEQRDEPLLPRPMFYRRVGRYSAVAGLLVLVSWMIGILGYRLLEHMSWIDAILNSAMLLGGMGPVNPLQTDAGKLFASFYALFSGMVFLVCAGLVVTPIAHRLLHQFHLDDDDSDAPDSSS